MRRFSYYNRLSAASKRTYRSSDAISVIDLPAPEAFATFLRDLQTGLVAESRAQVERASQALADEMLRQLGVSGVQVVIREVRPSNPNAELHGLYEPVDPPYRSRVSLWMRTAVRAQIVAYKTFVRTLVHEICHHLDYEYLGFNESFHTQGFYQRESSLVRQLLQQREITA